MSWFQNLVDGGYRLDSEVGVAELSLLYDIPQEPSVHGEGSVEVHTELALAETEKLIAAEPSLNPAISRLAAAFTHIDKANTTSTPSKGRTAAPGHEEEGFEIAGPLFGTRLDESVAAQKNRQAAVPVEAVRAMAEKFKHPTPDEYHHVVVVENHPTPTTVTSKLEECWK